MSGPGPASHAKLMANYTIAATIELVGEIYTSAEKTGVDKGFVKAQLDNMLGGPALQLYNQRISDRSFEPGGFALQGGLKDVNLMLEAAGEVHVPLPIANILRDRFLTAMSQDMGERDWAALTEIIRQSTNIA